MYPDIVRRLAGKVLETAAEEGANCIAIVGSLWPYIASARLERSRKQRHV